MRTITLYDGTEFKAEQWGERGNVALIHKPTGQIALVSRGKYWDGCAQAFIACGASLPGDVMFQWLWTNAGFHRFA